MTWTVWSPPSGGNTLRPLRTDLEVYPYLVSATTAQREPQALTLSPAHTPLPHALTRIGVLVHAYEWRACLGWRIQFQTHPQGYLLDRVIRPDHDLVRRLARRPAQWIRRDQDHRLTIDGIRAATRLAILLEGARARCGSEDCLEMALGFGKQHPGPLCGWHLFADWGGGVQPLSAPWTVCLEGEGGGQASRSAKGTRG